MGRLGAPHDAPRRVRCLARPRRRRRCRVAVQVPHPRRRRPVGRPRGPVGPVRREAAELRLEGVAVAAPVERRGVAREAPHEPARRRGDVDVRGAPRLVAQALLGRALHVGRDRRRARPLRLRPRLHPRRVHAGDAAPVRRLVGLPRHLLLRPRLALRRPRRAQAPHRPAPPGRRRGDPGLGARALRHRRVGPGPLRRHPALRGPQPPARLAQGVGLPHLQLRPQRGAQLPLRQRGLLARGVPRRRPARGRRRLDDLPRLRP